MSTVPNGSAAWMPILPVHRLVAIVQRLANGALTQLLSSRNMQALTENSQLKNIQRQPLGGPR